MENKEIHGHGKKHCKNRRNKVVYTKQREKIEKPHLKAVVYKMAHTETCSLLYRSLTAESEICGKVEIADETDNIAHRHIDIEPESTTKHLLHQKIYCVLDCSGYNAYNHKTQYLPFCVLIHQLVTLRTRQSR